MTNSQYNWCLTAFFFTYAAFEVPSNLLLKKLRPSRWLPLIMVGPLRALTPANGNRSPGASS
jgi:hypothetical protein